MSECCRCAELQRTKSDPTGHASGTVEFGVITSFAYKLEDGSGEIVVATTRCVATTRAAFAAPAASVLTPAPASPETMLGDTAVAIHPDDPR